MNILIKNFIIFLCDRINQQGERSGVNTKKKK